MNVILNLAAELQFVRLLIVKHKRKLRLFIITKSLIRGVRGGGGGLHARAPYSFSNAKPLKCIVHGVEIYYTGSRLRVRLQSAQCPFFPILT